MTGKVWFRSDDHFNHANIIEYCNRPFKSVDEMNEALIANHNELVSPDDTVFHLGDVGMGDIEKSLALVHRLNGHKVLLAGNHDRCFVQNKKYEDWIQRYKDAGFEQVATGTPSSLESIREGGPAFSCVYKVLELVDPTVKVYASHFPYKTASDTERYSDCRVRDTGDWLLHGHVHDLWQFNGRQINVGVDVWDYKPVSSTTLIQYIRSH